MPTRRQVLEGATSNGARAVLAVGAFAALSSCTNKPTVAPKLHAYLLRTFGNYRRDLVICDAAGHNPKNIVHGVYGRPAWTPDGKHLAVARGAADDSLGTWAMWVVGVDGVQQHQVTNPASGVADIDPAFAFDGKTIAFSRDTVGFGAGQGLWLVHADGGGLQYVPGGAGGIAPCFSPNGKTIVYAAADGLRLIPTGGGSPHLLIKAGFAWQFAQPAWSPDGKWVAFVRHDSFGADSLCYLPASGGKWGLVLKSAIGIESPGWSSDSKTLAYLQVDGIGAEGRRSSTVMRIPLGGFGFEAFRPAGPPATDLSTWPGLLK